MPDPVITTVENFIAHHSILPVILHPNDMSPEEALRRAQSGIDMGYQLGVNGNVVNDGDYEFRASVQQDIAQIGAGIKAYANQIGFDLTQLDDVRAAAAWDQDPSDLSDMELGSLVVSYGLQSTTLISDRDNVVTELTNVFNMSSNTEDYEEALAIQLGHHVYKDNTGNLNGAGLDTSDLQATAEEKRLVTGEEHMESENCVDMRNLQNGLNPSP